MAIILKYGHIPTVLALLFFIIVQHYVGISTDKCKLYRMFKFSVIRTIFYYLLALDVLEIVAILMHLAFDTMILKTN